MSTDSNDDAGRPSDRELAVENARDGETDGEDRYKARIAIALAVLVVLGAWIAVLQTNASTNEAASARRATRLAAEAQTANVLEAGANAATRDVAAERLVFSMRDVFTVDEALAADVGVTVDPEQASERLTAAQDAVDSALDGDADTISELMVRARQLSLEQGATVEERVTWNARSSQYETVLAALAVAIFLVGFTVVVRRKARPPLAVPALLLAIYCFGWAVYIYRKPIPETSSTTIDATARGQAELAMDEADRAIGSFSAAIESDSAYEPPFSGRGLALLVASNPDVLNTLAFTDTSPAALDPVLEDLERSLELGGDERAAPLTVAGLAHIAAGNYEEARVLLRRAVDLNDLTPGTQFALSAVEAAMGNEQAARSWRDRAASQLTATENTDRNQTLVAVYFTLLEWIADENPEQADLAASLREETAAAITETAAGRPLRPDSAGGRLEVNTISFMGDTTTIGLSPTGVPADATVAVFGYEQPAPGATFVQPHELGYVGPADASDITQALWTPRACAPVAYRFDLYVEGKLVDSADAPGVAPTC